jgi:hypothetical protein
MKQLKRVLGMIWIGLAIAAGYFCIFQFGLPKILSGKQDDLVFGIIILFILTPLIVTGLGTFGYYALMGEYDNEKR